MQRDRLGQQRIDGVALTGIADGVLRDIAEAHGAVAFERGDPGIGRGRHHGAAHAVRNLPAMFAHEDIGRQGARPVAQARDGLDRAIREPDHDRRDTRDIHQVRQQHAQRHAGRAAGIDRIAAGFEHRHRRGRREIMPGRDRMARAGERGAGGEHRQDPPGGWLRKASARGGHASTAAWRGRAWREGCAHRQGNQAPCPTPSCSPSMTAASPPPR